MSYLLLESRCGGMARAAVFVALALALAAGKLAWAKAPVTEEQTEAAVVAARATEEEVSAKDDDADLIVDARYVERVIWSEPEDAPEWFPPLDEGVENVLTLTPSPMQTPGLSALKVASNNAPQELIANEHTVIPLPPAAWTGLAGLASLFTIRGRKAIVRFFFT
jgi:hypothetical protein